VLCQYFSTTSVWGLKLLVYGALGIFVPVLCQYFFTRFFLCFARYIFFPVLCQFVVTQLVRIFSDIWVAVWVRKVRS
jgi:hypothetical protein